MERIWQGFYASVVVPAMWVALRVAALFDEKARQVLAGQRTWGTSLADQLRAADQADPDRASLPTVWLHATSVGEFEQTRPLISQLHPSYRIVATRFSPSVERAMDRNPEVDASIYLPLDSRRNVARLFDMVRPSALIFSKFDVWPNCVWEAARRGVPLALIAGTIHSRSRRLRPVARRLLRHVHRHMALQCVVTEEDATRMRALNRTDARILVTGDTRFDQVYARAQGSAAELPLSRTSWPGFCVFAGSTYSQDERVLIPAFNELREAVTDARLVLVPHEPTQEHVAATEDALSDAGLASIRYSDVEAGADLADNDVLLVDRIGVLAALYVFGSVAFVGGSFRARVHNVMEPAVLAKPVIIGPLMDNSSEAYGLLECGGALRVSDQRSLAAALIDLARSEDRVAEMGAAGRDFIVANLGATDRTLEALRTWVV